jgi:hypothetical protein
MASKREKRSNTRILSVSMYPEDTQMLDELCILLARKVGYTYPMSRTAVVRACIRDIYISEVMDGKKEEGQPQRRRAAGKPQRPGAA